MCGLVGVLATTPVHERDVRQMAIQIRHRGPDDSGVWIDPAAGIGLGHVRLSIIDLSVAGHQPMCSASGRYVIAFNGEIYNHLTLRLGLAKIGSAPDWRGHSDTETLLAGFDAWGIEATVKRTVGMFAFAVWDREKRELTLVRDRVGEKPMYYGWQGHAFLFGSEVKGLKAHPAFTAGVDRGSVALLLRHNYIPAPYSIYQGIGKQLPGTLLTVSLRDRTPRVRHYWDLRTVVQAGNDSPFEGSPEDAVTALEDHLREAVRRQMMSDVPLGAFLSGGLDSSTIVALMQTQSTRPVRTFTIGFREDSYNEATHAKAVAEHLGTDHTELYVSPRDALDVIPKLPSLYCEPFADSSQVPTYLVSQLARRAVTVSLSGDAGDELFAGYNRYRLAQRLWTRFAPLPGAMRVGLAHAIASLSAEAWTDILRPFRPLLPKAVVRTLTGERVLKGAAVLGARTPASLYRTLVSHWLSPEEIVIGGREHPTVLDEPARQPQSDHFVHQMMALDLLTYLPDDILVKVDRAAMAVSLETRVPFLDHEVVEFAWRLPLDYKLRNGVGKWPLRQVLYKYVPPALVDRPKMGFGIPIDSWLRGPLREWGEDLLDESRLRRESFFHPEPIRRMWLDHLSGKRNMQYQLWDVLMFQAWLAETN